MKQGETRGKGKTEGKLKEEIIKKEKNEKKEIDREKNWNGKENKQKIEIIYLNSIKFDNFPLMVFKKFAQREISLFKSINLSNRFPT